MIGRAVKAESMAPAGQLRACEATVERRASEHARAVLSCGVQSGMFLVCDCHDFGETACFAREMELSMTGNISLMHHPRRIQTFLLPTSMPGADLALVHSAFSNRELCGGVPKRANATVHPEAHALTGSSVVPNR